MGLVGGEGGVLVLEWLGGVCDVLEWTKLTNRWRSNGSAPSVEFTEENRRWGKCWGISYPNTLKSV